MLLVLEHADNILQVARVYCKIGKTTLRSSCILASDDQMSVLLMHYEDRTKMYGRYFETMILHSAVSVHRE